MGRLEEQVKRLFGSFIRWWDRAKQEFKVIAIKRAKIRHKEQSHERFQLENAQNDFLCDAMPRLTEEESMLCEGALTEEEPRKR